MFERENKRVYYDTDVIKSAHCDLCNKEVTEEEFFQLELRYIMITDEDKRINDVYDESPLRLHICKDCIKSKLNNLPVKEYIDDLFI